jgi:hypothetical protein
VGTTTGKKEDEVNRLHDMLVHEVSLVDRAANGTTFLLLKRDGKMGTTGAEVVENEKGELNTVEETVEPTPVAPVVKVEEYALAKDLKEKLQSCTTEALKRLTDVAVAVKALPDGPEGGGLPGDLALELVTVLELLIGIENCDSTVKGVFIDNTTKSSALRMLSESMERLSNVVSAVKSASEGDSTEIPMALATEMTAIAHLVGGVIERHAFAPEASKTEKALEVFHGTRVETDSRLNAIAKAAQALKPVEKAGAKMSASRLGKLKTAISQLMELLKDVDPSIVEELLGGVAEAKEAASAKAAVKKNEEVVVEKATSDAKLAELTAEVEALTKKLAKKDADLSRLSKSVAMPNSLVVEHAPSVQSSGPVAQVGWPSDMNRPVSKETIKKEHWFDGE